MAKLKAGRMSREVTDSCLQFWGGQGYMWESHIARAYRDSRLISIGGGERRGLGSKPAAPAPARSRRPK
jgi:citronellyl-CoA dehydrogenase